MTSIKDKFRPFNLKCNNLVELEIKDFFAVIEYRYDLIKKLNFKSLLRSINSINTFDISSLVYNFILKLPFIKVHHSKIIFIN